MHPITDIQGSTMDWTYNYGLYQKFTMWKQNCLLFFGCQLEGTLDNHKAKSVLQWSGNCSPEIHNGCNISDTPEDTLAKYWHRWNDYC